MFGVAWKVTKVLFERMNELEAPHGYYDGPLKELAARHLGLIKAFLFALLITIPIFCFLMIGAENARIRDYADKPSVSVIYGFEVGSREYYHPIKFALAIAAIVFLFHGACNLVYRFYRLIKLLYPHLTFYFTLLVFVPFLNVMVILLLLWGALRQMRRRGLRVGVFGIDPARFE